MQKRHDFEAHITQLKQSYLSLADDLAYFLVAFIK